MMRKFLSFCILCFSGSVLLSQNVLLRGHADDVHKGKRITLYTYEEMITYTRVKLASDTVNQEGDFQLAFDVNGPTRVEIWIENLQGNLYVVPRNYYFVTFPAPDSLYDLNPNAEYPVELGFVYKESGDTTELNSLIINFNREFRKFYVENYQYIVAKKVFTDKLDSFQLASYEKYKHITEPTFRIWLEYTFADLNESLLRNRAMLANLYIVNKPIRYNHYEYMKFFNIYFSKYLQIKAATKKGAEIIDIINESGDARKLNTTLQQDPVLQNDSMRELVMIKGLYEIYYTPDFKRDKVLAMLEQISRETKNAWHKEILKNIIMQIYRLTPGSDAPAFTLKNSKGELISLSNFRGKYVYLNFMSSESAASLQEMKEMADMKKKYADKVAFISISIDEKEEDLQKFLKKNPKYDWLFLWHGNDQTVKTRYNIKALPTFYFINREGQLVLSTAPAPSQGFEGTLQQMFHPKKKPKGP